MSIAETDITEFQVGGLKDDQPVTAATMIEKAVKFRATAGEHGVTCKVLLQDYRSLDLPPNPNFVNLQQQKDTLADCFRQRNLLLKNLNDVEFILSNPGQFDAPASGVNLNAMRDQLAAALNVYADAASRCVNDFRTCAIVTPAPPLPDLNRLPARKAGVLVTVPNWVGVNLNDFRDPLPAHPDLVRPEAIGLLLVFQPIPTTTGEDGIIQTLNPPAGAQVSRGTTVTAMAFENVS